MKTALLILATIFSFSLSAQTKGEKIWQYASDHLGERIGDGNCDELLIYAYKAACDCQVREKVGRNLYHYSYGKRVSRDSVVAGDIIVVNYYDKETGEYADGHVAVVYSVTPTDLEVIHQNNGLTKQKDTFLMIATYDEITSELDDSRTFKVLYYHPI
jgi:hypothetical protein